MKCLLIRSIGNNIIAGVFIIFSSCGTEIYDDKAESRSQNTIDTSGFSAIKPEALQDDSNFAAAFTLNESVYQPGDVYLAKIFLSNNTIYDPKSVTPDIRFVHQRKADYSAILNEGAYAPVINDTGYVRFIVEDPGIEPGDTVLTSWVAYMSIPLEGKKDTAFGYMRRFFVTK